MKIYAIGDLHLPGGLNKSMERFGWKNHQQKIFQDWDERVQEEDLVLLAGDISWAMNLEDAALDLQEISRRRGKKIMIKGNHDYWWASLTKMQQRFPAISFLYNNYFRFADYAICGTRGWLCPNDVWFGSEDLKIYRREINRLRLSLQEAKKNGAEKIICMIHYPPTNDKFEKSGFTDLFQEYGVEKVIYGHLHGEESFSAGIQGYHEGIEYFLVSCDYLGFRLKTIE